MAERLAIRDFGTQLSFNGTSSRVDVDNASFGASLSQCSFSAWVKPVIGSEMFIVARAAATSDQFGITASGLPTFALNIGGSSRSVTALKSLSKLQWSHLAATYDGSTIKIYINGVLSNSTNQTGALTNTGLNWDIGCRGAGGFYKGELDEILVWSVGLTETQVSNLYLNGEIVTTGLVGKWLCNEGSGSTLTDTSGNGNNGSITSTTFVTVPPLKARTTVTSRTTATNRVAVRDMGTALSFDGVDDYVEIPDADIPASTFQNGFTLSAWINPRTLGEGSLGNIIDKSNGINGVNGFCFQLTGTNQIRFRSNTTSHNSPTNSIILKTKYFVAVSVDSSGNSTLYINGIATGASLATGALSAITTTSPIRIGNRATVTDRTFDGIIDEPRIWNRALTATEIQNLYLHGAVPQDGLVAEYLFDEGTGTTAIDTSGNGNDGTITGATYTTDTPLRPRTSV